MPNIFLSPHIESYDHFLHKKLVSIFNELFYALKEVTFQENKIKYFSLNWSPPVMPEEECLKQNRTYGSYLNIRFDIEEAEDEISLSFIKTFIIGLFPLFTPRCSFIIDGKERAPIAQLLLYPGVYFELIEDRKYIPTWKASIRPQKGGHLRFIIQKFDDGHYKAYVEAGLQEKSSLPIKKWPLKEFLEKINFLPDAEEILGHHSLWEKTITANRKESIDSEAAALIRKHFFSENKEYDLSETGRQRINGKLGNCAAKLHLFLSQDRHLNKEDIIVTLAYLLELIKEESNYRTDDLNHLKNRRVILLGDQMDNLFSLLAEQIRQVIDKELKESPEMERVLGITHKIVEKALNSYFKNGELCQLLDQTNPLSEVSHKRKLTFRGPGGVRAKYGSLDKRDVHYSHYGRICLCETPESNHIGLNLHFATFARINKEGQIETPCRKPGQEETYLTPAEEETLFVAPPDALPDKNGKVAVRHGAEEAVKVTPDRISYTDAYPGQLLGLAASLIPFIQHNDLNRVMMGAKNMKQALPLIQPEQPLIKSGMEELIARLCGRVPAADVSGLVTEVSDRKIVLRPDDGQEKVYKLQDYSPTITSTCLYHKPMVRVNEHIEKGQLMADGAAMKNGELALGANLLVAYMPWHGYNFEDGIVISDRLVEEDILTSIHVQEKSYKILANEVTFYDVKKSLSNQEYLQLDETGIIREGSPVEPGAILVRKYRLYKGKRIGNHLDKKAEDGLWGKVIKVMRVPVGREKEVPAPGASKVENPRLEKEIIKIWISSERKVQAGDKLMGRYGNKGVVTKIIPRKEMPCLSDGTPVDVLLNPHGIISRMNLGQILETHLGWVARNLACHFKAAPFEKLKLLSCPDEEIEGRIIGILGEKNGIEEQLRELMNLTNEKTPVKFTEGKTTLTDKKTGQPFGSPVVVGYQYFMKLNHLVEKKLHVREEGGEEDYALITQQPTRGRPKGGQRLGEMEVWALEAHHTPNLLREFLSYKSDDVMARNQVWEELGLGREWMVSNLPESFRALTIFLRGLGVKLSVYKSGSSEPEELTYRSTIAEQDIEKVRISIASENDILQWGPREVKKELGPSQKVEKICVCACKNKKWDLKTIDKTCSGCGKKIREMVQTRFIFPKDGIYSEEIFGETDSEDRRQNMAHIKLHCPIINPLFSRHLSRLLDEDMEPFMNFERLFVNGQEMSWQEYKLLENPDTEALSGAEYIKKRLEEALAKDPGLGSNNQWGSDPYHTIMDRIPVIPPDLRPLIAKEDHGVITAGLNKLYRKVMESNNLLGLLLELKNMSFEEASATASSEIYRKLLFKLKKQSHKKITWRLILQEKNNLQRAINELFIKGHDEEEKHPYSMKRHWKSLGELLEGKEGLFRKNLLGKRVNYSGRSVIIPDPGLNIDEFGLPYEMAIKMMRKMTENHLMSEKLLSEKEIAGIFYGTKNPELRKRGLDALTEVLKDRVILLNRAPTLHRYNILSFKPKLTENQAISLHPLVCGAFNADFDGDTMALHLPLLKKSQEEARQKCSPVHHFLSIANGSLTLHLAQDIVLGIYYLTGNEDGLRRLFDLFGDENVVAREKKKEGQAVTKSELSTFLTRYFWEYGEEKTASLAQDLMILGFQEATKSGLSFSIFDVPWVKKDQREALLKDLLRERPLDLDGLEALKRSDKNLYEEIIEKWKEQVTKELDNQLKSNRGSPFSLMVLSGARGDMNTITQLGGMRGLMTRPGGIVPEPVASNFREGLSSLEFFLSSHGSRKTMVDKKLGTASAGDLTRRLVEAAYPLVIAKDDCKTEDGILIKRELSLEDKEAAPFTGRLVGRVILQDLLINGNIVAYKGDVVSRELAEKLTASNISEVKFRSVLTCQLEQGVCRKCYGWDPSQRGDFPEVGLPVGIIAGQSVGERGTQLTMRTFHSGGVKGEDITQGLPDVKRLLEGRLRLRLFEITDPKNSGLERCLVLNEWDLCKNVEELEEKGLERPEFRLKRNDKEVVEFDEKIRHLEDLKDMEDIRRVFLRELHKVYKKQAVDDRHFEVILRAMSEKEGGHWRIKGITQAALKRKSFLSTASFQRTLEIIAEAAVKQDEDLLQGYKERLMLGKSIQVKET